MAIKRVKSVAKAAFTQLKHYQQGKLTPIKTGREWLDTIFGGLLPMEIVTIAGASGGGKSFELQRIKNFVMNPENNPDAKKFVWVDHSLEMKYISNIIRDLNMKLGKSKKKILTEIFSEEEQKLVKDYFDNTTDDRFFIDEEAVIPTVFETNMIEFLEEHKTATAVFCSVDHIALQKDKNGDKKATVDEIVEVINRLKKRFPNSYWFLLTQLNRNVLGRTAEKNIMSMPNRGDIFQSDSMFFISDYLYVTHNPYRLGINQFSKVSAEVYDYLAQHFGEESNGKVSFETLGKIFYIVLKSREAEIIFKDIYIEDVEIKDKEKYKEPKEKALVLDTPMFKPRPIDLTVEKSEAFPTKTIATPDEGFLFGADHFDAPHLNKEDNDPFK